MWRRFMRMFLLLFPTNWSGQSPESSVEKAVISETKKRGENVFTMTRIPLMGCLTSEKGFKWQKGAHHDTHPSPGCVPGGVGNAIYSHALAMPPQVWLVCGLSTHTIWFTGWVTWVLPEFSMLLFSGQAVDGRPGMQIPLGPPYLMTLLHWDEPGSH